MYTRPLPTHERLKELFDYTPSGNLIWRTRKDNASFNARFGQTVAGCLDYQSYRTIYVDGLAYRAHRLVWKWHHGTDPGETIDHLNHKRDDNRIENLASVTMSDNARNRTKPASYVTRKGNRFQAQISLNGRCQYVGSFASHALAHEAALVAMGAA